MEYIKLNKKNLFYKYIQDIQNIFLIFNFEDPKIVRYTFIRHNKYIYIYLCKYK